MKVSEDCKPKHEAVRSGTSARDGSRGDLTMTTDAELVSALISRLGGPYAAMEQLSSTLAADKQGSVGLDEQVDENTVGYCYLKLFDRIEHRDAVSIGPFPQVADLRRFSNGRKDPFGLRSVEVLIDNDGSDRVAHVRYRGGPGGMRPVAALAALAKDCKVGGLPPGPITSVIKLGSSYTVPFEQFLRSYNCGLPDASDRCTTLALELAMVCVPSDLPFNIPDPDKYPYSRYTGLQAFATALPYGPMWSFLYDLGAKKDQTPTDDFWTQAFSTGGMLSAYFKLLVVHRNMFVQMVAWLRDPIPGRPGGVQVVPPEWPAVIPTPLHHTMTRYAGIAEWVRNLPAPWPEVCRMSLFGIHEPFDPVWWADYHKTVDVYILYNRLSPELRISFEAGVYWIPDGTPNVTDVVAAERADDGYCYLKLFCGGSRPLVRAKLGANPWASAVVAALIQFNGSWSSGRFQLTVTDGKDADGKMFHQGHVVPANDGLSVPALIGMMSGAMRVGATNDLNALADIGEEQVAVRPTIFPTVPVRGGQGMELSFSLYAVLGKDAVKYPPIAFNVLQEPVMAMMLGVYESVQLVSAKFIIDVPTGATNGIYAAICPSGSSLVTDLDWLATPINQVVYGSDQGHVHANFELPKVHPFERELRAGSYVGNPIPTFRFSFAGNAGAIGVVRGQLVVRCRGQYVMGHLRIGAPATGKSLRTEVERIHDTMNYEEMGVTRAPVVFGGVDDDSEDEKPTRSSGPRTISGAPKSGSKCG